MQSFSKLVVSLATLLLTVVACSGSGISTPAGSQCTSDYTPFPMAVAPTQKGVSLKVNDPDAAAKNLDVLKPGKYTYARADLYFIEKTVIGGRQFKTQVVDAPDNTGTFQKSVACSRDSKARVPGRNISVTGISQIVVSPTGAPTMIASRPYNLKVTDRGIDYSFPAAGVLVPGSPDTFFDSGNPKPFNKIMLRNNDTDYEIRTEYDDDQGQYFLNIHLTWTPPAH